VESVNWYEALHFANRLSELAGLETCYELDGCEGAPGAGCVAGEPQCMGDFVCAKVKFRGLGCPGFRLPTEAEWELAARSSTTTAFATGDQLAASAARFGVVAPASGPVAAGSFPAGPGGLYDVHGNVREWVWDEPLPFPSSPVEDPIAGLEVGSTAPRVTRGGSWSDEAAACRSADREAVDPRVRRSSVGFRLVKTE
jgi:formylglycine-generating enzyme required for sulfatase activity